MSPRWTVAVVALIVAGCGGSAKRPAVTTAVTSTPSATATATTPPTTATTTAPPQAHAEIPALYTVTASGSLQPPTISVPAAIPIQLTVISRDGRAHTAVLQGHTLHVPAGGHDSVLISGLKRGTYPLSLDGRDRGALVIGAQPGP